MKDLTTILPNVVAQSTGQDKFAQVSSSDLTTGQKGAIKYFYARLQRIYLAEYRRQLPDESTERASKGEFGALVMNIPKETMDKGFDALHEELRNVESEYRFMKMDAVIDLVSSGGNLSGHRPAMYREFAKALPVPPEELLKRKKAGREELDKMMGMFDDE